MTNPKLQIGFDHCGIGTVLKRYKLRVPPNQREYSWTDREVTRLLFDFRDSISAASDGYFLGTLVTIPRDDDTLEVVDGQQRLATTAILCAAVRDYLEGKEPLLVESINRDFLFGIDRESRTQFNRLQLNLEDNQLFGWIITADARRLSSQTKKPSHERLRDAYAKARDFVNSIVDKSPAQTHGDILNDWLAFVEQRALVVLLRVTNDADAYKMFETLNDRGLRTTQADLIKNYLFGQSGARIAEVQHRWSQMRGILESLEDDNVIVDFLRHAVIAIRGYTREAEIYEKVQERAKGKDAAVQFCSDVAELAVSYVSTFNPEHENWNGHPLKTRQAIEVFNLLNIRPMRPLLLAIANKVKQRQVESMFEFLVSLGVRLLVTAQTRTGSVESGLASAARAVYRGTITRAEQLRQGLAKATPTNEEFKAAFEIARVSKAKLARYYLRALENAAQQGANPWFALTQDQRVVNWEHVLPRNPEDHWPQFDDEDVRVYVNRLGNQALMLADDNSGLQSQNFQAKKLVYANAPYELTSQLAGYSDWSANTIANRQKELAKLALRAWPI